LIPLGFRFGGARCGLKNKRNDLGLIVADAPCAAAGVFTQNLVRASCVDYSQSVLEPGRLQAIVANSGNANCCTGAQGAANTRRMAALAARSVGCDPSLVAVASTGVIGRQLDMEKVEKGIDSAVKALGADPHGFMDAILTTDLVEKQASANVGQGRIYGVAKGSGMIAPNMATMLAFIVTDVVLEPAELREALIQANEASFNRTTVDADTSTNDMVLVMGSGASGVKPSAAQFGAALNEVCVSLAKQIARDGEGATKLVEVVVRGSEDPERIARTIAESPLVKTAMFGCDPNWGRIMMAAGRAGVPFDVSQARLSLKTPSGDFTLFKGGEPTAYDPKAVSAALKADAVLIHLDLGPGRQSTIYTCDLGYGYVRINAEYHT